MRLIRTVIDTYLSRKVFVEIAFMVEFAFLAPRQLLCTRRVSLSNERQTYGFASLQSKGSKRAKPSSATWNCQPIFLHFPI